MKRKHPKDCVNTACTSRSDQEVKKKSEKDGEVDSDDDNVPEIVVENQGEEEEDYIDLTTNKGSNIVQGTEVFVDLTNELTVTNDITVQDLEEDDVIIRTPDNDLMNDTWLQNANGNVKTMSHVLKTSEDELIPDKIYWESLLASLERCENDIELLQESLRMKATLPPLHPRKIPVHFNPDCDFIDAAATASLPSDCPQNVHAILTEGDGNCFGRSLSKGYSGNDGMHLEIRARTVIEGAVNQDYYASSHWLNRGASVVHDDEPTAHIYAKYSDHYVNGQKITENTVDYLYYKELLDCSKVNAYMGLWQLAQASSALNTPIKSVFPEGTDELMHLDFNRMFFPVDWNNVEKCEEPLIVMWTGLKKGFAPVHFVPLLLKRIQ